MINVYHIHEILPWACFNVLCRTACIVDMVFSKANLQVKKIKKRKFNLLLRGLLIILFLLFITFNGSLTSQANINAANKSPVPIKCSSKRGISILYLSFLPSITNENFALIFQHFLSFFDRLRIQLHSIYYLHRKLLKVF